MLEIEIVPRSELVKQGGESSRYRPRLFAELALQYEAAAAEAQAAGTLITQKNIFHPISLVGYHPEFACNESDLRYCPQYQVGTVNKIRLTVTNRDPTILIKAESTSVTEGQPARFILERRWATDLLALPPPQSETVVYLQASQDGQYVTGALPTQITFGQNETRKVIELQTVDDSAFGDNGSVTIELLPDASTGSENLHGMYSVWENWVGHTPTGGRSDKATVTITNDDDKPGITIAPASATEGDSGNTNVTFTLTLGQAVSGAVAVNYATSDGTATAGQDYTAVTSGTATIPANSTSATFTVSVTGDTADEANETFNVTISLPDGGGASPPDVAIVGGGTATVSGTIVDDDPVVVTVAPKADSVVEGEDAVFVLTRTGYTDDALSMQVRLSAPGKVETLSAEFETGATTAELSVETEDNDLVDYPSARDYTIEALGDGDINDGDINDRDDEIYTPGDPSQATVSVTDNDKLQIITVYPHEAFVAEGGEAKFVFRRTGDTSEELRFTYMREQRQAETTEFENYLPVSETFPAGLSEITSDTPVTGGGFPSDDMVDRLYPYKITAQVYGDGHRYGVHRIWKAGTPNTATVVYYDDDRTRGTVLRANYPGLGQVGQTINIDFEVLNTGSEATGNTITVSSVQLAGGDRDQTKPAEPRAGCSISGSLATGEIGTCRATFTLTAQDLTDSPMVLEATASDGTTTSSTLRIYITVLGGVAVGFKETARLSVTEPANGAANAQAVLAVTRVGESGQQVQVAYTVEPIHTQNRLYPAEEGADYEDNSATPGILTFAPNETEKNITIDILGDEIDEPTELLRVTLVPPEGVLVEAAKRNRAVAIVNRDPPSGESYLPTASLELVSADPTPESAGSVDFAVVLDRVWGEDARFEVELDAHDNLTATPAFSRLGQTGDFEAPDGLIHATIPAGQTRFEFSLTLYDDDVREEDETFQMLLGSSITSSQRRIGDEDEALVTIADDDFVEPTGVELALTSNNGVFDSVSENSSQHDITVTASFSDIRWPTDTADAALRPADPRDVDTTVRVEFDSANSAAAQTDIERFQVADSQDTFQDVESFDIVIPAGQTSGTTTLRFKPANDDVDEEAETVILQGAEVVASDSDEFLTINSASFTITDDDTRGITVSPASLATGSGIGMMEGGTSTYSLVLDSEPTDTVTVTVSSEQDNLIRLTPETLTFTPSNWSTTQTISVVSLDDGADTSFTNATIAHGVSGGDYGSVSVGDISVNIENTTQAYIYLDDAQASESDGYVEFTVSVRPILRTVPVVVRYTTVDGTAAAGTDYTRQVNTGQTYKIFSIPANGGAATIRIPITDNEVYGPAKKTFTLQLTNQNNKALLDGDATSLTATGSIIDDDPKPVVSVAGPAGDLSYVSEDMKGPVTFTLTLTGRSAADVTVDYTTGQAQVLSGLAARQDITSATAGEDYTAATGTVTFSSGDATKQVTVQLTDDDVSEDTEFFGFKISNAQNAQLRNKATEEVADVGLLDDDPRGVAIDPTSISLEEPAPGEAAVASSYTVKLNSKPTDTVTVTIGGANPAVSLSGATLSNTNTLTFTTSNWDTAQTVTVTPVEDTNGVGETITLTHIQSGGDYTGIAADSVTVNVTDSDTRNVVLSPTSLTVTEGDDTGVSYAVKLSTQPSDTVTVTIGGHSGTDLSISGATLSNSNTLTFSTSNWNTAQMVTVKAGHDGNADDESETLTHTASGGDYANLTKDLPVTVTDNAPATVTVSFGAASYTVTEGSSRTVTVTLDADPERTVVIPIEKTNQGGATSADYSGVPQNVTFDSGDTSKSFTFTAAHDTDDDDDESVKLSFGATLPTGVSAGTPATSTVTITDDDDPAVTVMFGQATYTVDESDDTGTTGVTENTVEVTVTLSADPERTVIIPIEKTNQGGATTADYSGVPQNVTFGSGETSKSFTFTASHDTDDDDGESVKLSFGATLPTGVTAGTPATSAVTITDDDVPSVTVSFGSAAYTVAESNDSDTTDVTENTVEVTVTLSADPERTVVIPLTATGQGATSADYSGVPQNVTFDSGDTSKSFTFTAATDTVDDDGESVKLSFGATLPTGVSAGTPATSTVTITDDDVPSVTVSFGSAAYTVAESDDPHTTDVTENTVEVTVTLDADPERTVIIPIAKTNQGGATTADYSGVPQSVTFGSGETSKSFTFTASHDTVDDDGESVKLSFGATLPTGVTAGTPATSAVTITDDDVPSVTVSFGAASYTVTEGASRTVTVTLDADPERTVVIPIEKTDQGGATTADYSGVPQNVTFGSGETSKTFDFEATQDEIDDDGEGVKLGFRTMPDARVSPGTTDKLTLSIDDDDTAAIVLSPTGLTVGESDTSSYTVKLATQPTATVTVTISGYVGTDLTLSGTTLTNDALTFTTTSWDTAQTVTVAAAHDLDSANDTASLTHTGGGEYAGLVSRLPVTVTESTVTITDDDPIVTVRFTQSAYTVAEGGTRQVTVTLSVDPERTVVIPLTATGQGTATSDDYSVPSSVTFNASDMSQTITFSATKDSINDDNESVLLAFGTLPAGVSPGTPDQATVSITDDTAVSYSSDNYSATEGGADAIVSVNLSRPAASQISIFITATGHNGATSEDWMGVPSSLTFNTGDSSNSFTVVAVDDEVEDNGEMVELGFRDLPAGFVPGSPPTARITLMNDDSTPNGALRLVDGVLTDEDGRLCEGRLEIFYNGAWGTICDDYWAKDDADVACRALGFVASVEDYDRYRTAYFGPGTEDQEIVLDDLLCNGDESGLLECPSGHPRPGIHNCRHSEDVGLRCLKVGQSPPWIIDVEFSGPPGGNGVYDAGETVEATLVWSEPVTISTPSGGLLPKVWVVYGSGASGHTDIAEYANGSGTDRTVFRHTLQSGSYSLVGVAYNSLGVRDGSIVSVESGLDAELGHSSYYSAQSENQAEAVTIIGVPTFNDPGPDNAWRAGEAVEVTFTFSRPVQVDTTGGAPSLPVLLSGAASRQALYLRGSGTRQLVFGYTLADADGTHSSLLVAPNSLALNGGSIQDVDNMLDAAIEHQGAGAFYVQQVVDETAPEVQSAAVDGATLTLAYNEDLDTGVTPPASAFAVNVNGASRSIDSASVSGSAVTLTLASAVESGDTVTADYTVPTGESANKLQDASGNAAESFSGQAVTNNTASSGTARSAPAPPPGSPTSLKVSRHESGKLLASWSAPNSGPAPTGYTLQWKESGDDWNDADDVSEASVKGTSHVITGLTDGVRYAMRVIAYKGDADGDPSGEVTATPQERAPPAPSTATVDGATMTITFDEPLDAGGTPNKSSFAVTVAASSRGVDAVSVSGSVVTLTLVTAVEAGEAVTVDYTVPTGATADRLRDLAGNTAASFSGREVTNNTAPAQSEESSESQDDTPNSPGNLNVVRHEIGQLRASWDAPDSGPTPTGYTLQWKESGDDWDDADDVSEANVNGTSHVITGLTGGVQYAVRVIAYKGDAESDPSGEITATPQETVPPSPSAASVDGATLTITFDEPLDTGEAPDKSSFAVTVAGSSRGVDTVSVSGSIVTLTLVTAVFAGEVVTMDYTVPADDLAARLQDLASNAAASFSGQQMTNDTQAADQLTASVSVVPESHDGSTVFTFELRFSETPRKRFSYKIMRDLAFTVTGGEVTGARRLVPTSNVGWEIHVRPDGNGPITIVLPVTSDCTAEGAICTEDRRPLSNRLEITVPAPGG